MCSCIGRLRVSAASVCDNSNIDAIFGFAHTNSHSHPYAYGAH
ncbi:hypothetical protein [Arthrobacter methylotrophus]|uniref:Uncharacterized protein n=1 Tax=Arthrobacter methylotrophus TaxID=121291 RepID=A0ABV5UNG4_9MICC